MARYPVTHRGPYQNRAGEKPILLDMRCQVLLDHFKMRSPAHLSCYIRQSHNIYYGTLFDVRNLKNIDHAIEINSYIRRHDLYRDNAGGHRHWPGSAHGLSKKPHQSISTMRTAALHWGSFCCYLVARNKAEKTAFDLAHKWTLICDFSASKWCSGIRQTALGPTCSYDSLPVGKAF